MKRRPYRDSYTVSELKEAPERLVEISITEKFSIDKKTLDDIQLHALKTSFDDLINDVPLLQKFAGEQGVSKIDSFEDAGLLLAPHTLYKSYPLSVLENGRYDQLTRWLNNLTKHDLSGLDVSGCETIDDWIFLLDTQTDLRLKHSSGTSGKLSFIPRSQSEMFTVAMGWRRFFDGFGDEPNAHIDDVEEMPMVLVYWRHGAMALPRMVDAVVQYLYDGDESRVLCANPTRISADMLSLGGRLRAAEAKGQLGRMQLSPALASRREAFIREQAEVAERQKHFFSEVAEKVKGQRVILYAVLPQLFEAAERGLRNGQRHLFSPDSLSLVAGGAKGNVFPSNFREMISEFSGLPLPQEGYGMTEMVTGAARLCHHDHYHIPPNIVPFLLDPETGKQRPRTGVQQGRFGFVDIATKTHWGGFLTGDGVTLHWGDTTSCPCGRKGVFVERKIQRYSEKEGGDDKITCAGAPDLLNRAMDFMMQVG